jgi:hypothetical protein
MSMSLIAPVHRVTSCLWLFVQCVAALSYGCEVITGRPWTLRSLWDGQSSPLVALDHDPTEYTGPTRIGVRHCCGCVTQWPEGES